MPHHRRLFRFRMLLSLSLVYGCSSQPIQKPLPPSASPPPVAASPKPSPAAPVPTASPQNELRLLNAAEIDRLKASGLVEANNRFGWELFKTVYAAEPGQNHFISPLSAAIALQMTMQGADGETLRQMRQTLGLAAIDNQTLLSALPLLMAKLRRPAADITLEVANSFWANQDYRFKPDFMSAVRGPFQAEVANLDFADPKVVDRINGWCAQATHDKIPKVIEQIPDPASTVAYLINAIYFNGTWTFPFDKAETAEKPFKLEDVSSKPVQMMRQFGQLPYLAPSDSFPHQGIALPYGKEGKLAMYVFLPSEGQTLADLQRDLQTQDFDALRTRFFREGGSLELPKFKLNWKRKLNDQLKSMGMRDVFSASAADLSKMSDSRQGGRLHVSYVEQFSFVELKEEGTEAAAVTVVEVTDVSSAPQRSHSMVVDHPFVFLIRDEETGQILFMGSITDPGA